MQTKSAFLNSIEGWQKINDFHRLKIKYRIFQNYIFFIELNETCQQKYFKSPGCFWDELNYVHILVSNRIPVFGFPLISNIMDCCQMLYHFASHRAIFSFKETITIVTLCNSSIFLQIEI